MDKDAVIWDNKISVRKALEMNLIDDKRWMDTIEDRNLMVHYYDCNASSEMCQKIKNLYCPLFVELERKMLVI